MDIMLLTNTNFATVTSLIYFWCVLLCSREIVPLSSIEHVQKKRRHDKEARMETVLVSSVLWFVACWEVFIQSARSFCNHFPSVPWCCWLVDRMSIWLVKPAVAVSADFLLDVRSNLENSRKEGQSNKNRKYTVFQKKKAPKLWQ